jgi:hypothetical protein
MSLNEWQASGYDLHSEIALPEEQIFADYILRDYRLSENSQAADKGTSLVADVVSEDINDISRPQGNEFDIGAYEYFEPSGTKDRKISLRFSLNQNYPNPFNPATKIRYVVGNLEFVTLKVFDIMGREITILVNEQRPAGEYEINFNASGLAGGVYFYKLQAGSYSSAKKLVLVK